MRKRSFCMRNIFLDPCRGMWFDEPCMQTPLPTGGRLLLQSNTHTMMKTISAVAFLVFLSFSGVYAQESDVIKQLKVEANSGDYSAAHVLATAYAVGDGVTKDRQESDHWYSVAASLRDKRATTQADTKLATTINDSSVKENKFLFLPKQNADKVKPVKQFIFGSVNNHETPSALIRRPHPSKRLRKLRW